jgi:hypothetical protein
MIRRIHCASAGELDVAFIVDNYPAERLKASNETAIAMESRLITPSPNDTLSLLLEGAPTPLSKLQGGCGLYSLSDENGVVRYIGETGMPFSRRIHNYHCAGDDNSHKFSTVFNAGRLRQMSSVDVSPAKRAVNDHADGRIAKELRCLFARARCMARVVDLPHLTTPERKRLEDGVLALAPPENKRWNDSRRLDPYEPDGLDDFLAQISWPSMRIEAVERQGRRWGSLAQADRVVIRKKRTAMSRD